MSLTTFRLKEDECDELEIVKRHLQQSSGLPVSRTQALVYSVRWLAGRLDRGGLTQAEFGKLIPRKATHKCSRHNPGTRRQGNAGGSGGVHENVCPQCQSGDVQ